VTNTLSGMVTPEEPVDDETAARLRWSIHGLFEERPSASARSRFSVGQVVGIGVLGVIIVAGFWIRPVITGTVCMGVMVAVYLLVLGMRIDLMVRSRSGRYEIDDDEARSTPEDELPTYAVMVPAYREPEVMPHLVACLGALEYPPSRLDVMLVLEADDHETLAAARALDLPAHIRIVEIPPSEPRTKPKALNFALTDTDADIVTIYDAEDRPDPLQLRKVASTLRAAGAEVACVQCELGYFNADENVITRWFATEYRMWFSRFLPQLSQADAAIPLGGTSNHLRRSVLLEAGAWDPFNVTEDADLGIRLRRLGHRVAVLDSVTLEEANTDFVNWVKQRSRWYKGYLQTWLVHMRTPRQLRRDLGWGGFVRFNLFVGGTPLLALLNPVAWVLLLLWFAFQPQFILAIMPWPIYYSGLLGWVVGNSLFYYLNLTVAFELGLTRVFRAALLLPLYWVMMSLAAVKAALQLIVNPSYWEKTQHGLSNHGMPVVEAELPDEATTSEVGSARP
jgi:glycosyltransferase XagB